MLKPSKTGTTPSFFHMFSPASPADLSPWARHTETPRALHGALLPQLRSIAEAESTPKERVLDDETREALEALGYL